MADNTYDIIFAGGGAAACITAGRLAEADPSLKILIVEAGPHTQELQHHIQPGRHFSNLLVPREVFSFHFGKGGKGTGERMHLVPAGRALGGGSAINFAMYMRPAPSDYDDWETEHGNEGWSSRELIPLLKKAETYQSGDNLPAHGYDGPIKISIAPGGYNVAEEMINVGIATEKDHGATTDLNDFTESALNKWSRIQRYIDSETGRRSDTAHSYIYNADHKNLTILVRHKVTRVVFEGTKAVGVEYIDDTVGRAKGNPEKLIAKASRLVVLASGAFGTPAILERSGIGAKSVLEKVGVKQLVDLPGVGENYLDHNILFTPYLASEDAETMDIVFRGNAEETEEYNQQWLKTGKGLLSNNGVDGGIKLRPTAEELKTLSPGYDHRWKSYYANKPDKPVILVATMAAYVGLNPEVPRGKYFSIAYILAHPGSVGSTHITSGTDSYASLDFKPGFLDDPSDVLALRWAYKRVRELARRMKYYRGDLVVGHPQFSKNSAAAIGNETGPVPLDAPRIVYTAEDDAAIDEYHKQNAETTWHSIGTTAMKPREKGGVVDSKLNVYGTTNLKVADCSITPSNVAANTYSTAIAIGEKAAVIIAAELGIKGVTARP
ncbi:alcohol oxidase [Pholiota conissans]|uniref:pyranose dehydrogenase (acceptor) n=1 Tax=Pholiota conissans TaxID=109636 RepID=A0A9P5Z1C7_9AGAR|nr:alcohol oxidase [Pholiota conissans]